MSTPIALHITPFLREHLPSVRNASPHTCDSYAYAFKLLFEFAGKRLKMKPSCLFLEHIDAPLVLAFLEHLEVERGNSVQSRNSRLAAIKTFFHFIEYRVPSALDQARRILAIPMKRTISRLVPYLRREEMQAILDASDLTSRMGLRDRAMLHVAFAAGLRVSELVGLHINDLTFQPSPTILVHGKGRRERSLPLWKETTITLRAWLAVRGTVPTTELFVNARAQPMTRSGFEYVLSKYVSLAAKDCHTLKDKRVSPHVLRHTCAMLTLQATGDVRKVALWLGHANVQTTEIYLRADPSEKLDAIASITPPNMPRGRFRPPDRLIALLKK